MTNKGHFKKGHKRYGTGMLGKSHSEVTKKKISEKKKLNPTNYWLGKKLNFEIWNKGKPHLTGEKNPAWKGGLSHKYMVKQAPTPRPDLCEICGAMGKICFDHSHETMKFRGWICQRCNFVLGLVKDSQDLLSKLSKYLDEKNNN